MELIGVKLTMEEVARMSALGTKGGSAKLGLDYCKPD